MQGIKYKFSVDALKVCYKIESNVYKYLTEETKDKQEIIYQSYNYKNEISTDFKLVRIKMQPRKFEIYFYEDENPILLGDIRISSDDDKEFKGQCYITLDNRRFYEPVAIVRGTKYNAIYNVLVIAKSLGLNDIISISNLEIAYDSNKNYATLIKKAIASPLLIPIINREAYPDIDSTETLKKAHLDYSTTRKRAKNLSFYVKQEKGYLQLKCYNKSKEIVDNGNKKAYIYKWIGMNNNIHRMEVTAKWPVINSYCKSKKIDAHIFISNLDKEEFLIEPYILWLNRIIHFKQIGKKKKISVLELKRSSL